MRCLDQSTCLWLIPRLPNGRQRFASSRPARQENGLQPGQSPVLTHRSLGKAQMQDASEHRVLPLQRLQRPVGYRDRQ